MLFDRRPSKGFGSRRVETRRIGVEELSRRIMLSGDGVSDLPPPAPPPPPPAVTEGG